jgi:starch-binding outer membrane protein, SusD/RagB family
MNTTWRGLLAASAVAVSTAGCGDFLSTDKVATDPNNPSAATRGQLFVAVQAAQFAQQEGVLALIACMYTQQCTGTSNFLQALEQYNTTNEDLPSPAFSAMYEGGGLIDLRFIEASALQAGDQQFLGIAKTWEALVVGTLADVWGDVPYREASNASEHPTPVLDPQAQVYDDLQALVTAAIGDLAGAGPGPGPQDLVYGGDVAKWTQAANSLKARLYMHTAELNGAPAYQAAIAAAIGGISTPANDWMAFHGANPQEDNIWFQFQARSGFGGFLVAGRNLADLMVARNDPRLPEYFGLASPGPGYGGQDPQGNRSPSGFSQLTGTRNAPDFRQPILTWAETQLILAEANFATAGAGAAQPYLDAVRASLGLPSVPATLNSIMEEKYVALFQNIEVWNDYKRTCYPAITPYPTTIFSNKVPGRVFYGTTEANANPNIPDEGQQLINGGLGFRNPNDPSPCP